MKRESATDEQKIQPLNCDRDAARWAREFNDALQTIYPGITPPRLDEGWLLGWFANAMMCGEDTYRWRQEARVSETRANECGLGQCLIAHEGGMPCDGGCKGAARFTPSATRPKDCCTSLPCKDDCANCPSDPKKDWGRAKVGVDGNCGYALLGENLQEGEAEFVEIKRDEAANESMQRAERRAWGAALKKLEERLGSGPLRYEVIQ